MRKLIFALAALLLALPAHATVTSTTSTVTYSPSVSTTLFTVTFHFTAKAQLKVTKTLIATGVGTVLTQGTDYTVRLPAGSTNGTVTTSVGVTSTHTLTIEREVPLTQTTSYKTQGRYNASAHEDSFDKLTMIVQQLAVGSVVATDITNAINTHEAAADPHVGYHLVAGEAGGQSATGGTAAGEDLTLSSTAHATKGSILFGTNSAYVESSDKLGIGTLTPSYGLEVAGSSVLASSGVEGGKLRHNYLRGITDTDEFTVQAIDTTETTDGGKVVLYSPTHSTKPKYLELSGTDITFDNAAGSVLLTMTTAGATFTNIGVLTVSGDGSNGTIYGDSTAARDLTLAPNSSAFDGYIYFGSGMAYDEANTRFGIGALTPLVPLEVVGQSMLSHYHVGFTSTLGFTNHRACNAIGTTLTSDGTMTLPDSDNVDLGCTVMLMNLATGNRVKLSPVGTDYLKGTCEAVALSGTIAKDAWNTAATAVEGDYIEVTNLASKTWYVTGCEGVWASEP